MDFTSGLSILMHGSSSIISMKNVTTQGTAINFNVDWQNDQNLKQHATGNNQTLIMLAGVCHLNKRHAIRPNNKF